MTKRFLHLLLIAAISLIGAAGCGTRGPAPATATSPAGTGAANPARTTTALQSPPCSAQGCPSLVITQGGQVSKINLAGPSLQPAAPMALPAEQTQNNRWTIDTGQPSPNGQWIAYTSIGSETGGPVLLNNLSTGEWTNLIAALNERLAQDRPAYPLDAVWDVIGWFPDSARLMIGPTDLSQVVIVSLTDYSARQILFPGGGRGGRLFVALAPDGSRFSYIGEDASGAQVLNVVDLASEQTTTLLKQPYAEGILYNPRFSPNQEQVAYLLQNGSPQNGLTYSINLLAQGSGQARGAEPRVLVSGNLGLTVPVWSPDGSAIAFTRSDSAEPQQFLQGNAPAPQATNLWVVSPVDGKATQLTFSPGQARSPVWASDGQVLAFVTEDGQVQMVSTNQPGSTWQAAGPSPDPALTSAFFLP